MKSFATLSPHSIALFPSFAIASTAPTLFHAVMRFLKLFSAAIFSFTMSAATPEKLTVYIGTYTGGPSKGIYAYEFKTSSGALKQIGLAAETESPSFLAIHPNNEILYAVNELDSYDGSRAGAIKGFKIDPTNPAKLRLINSVSSKGAHPCHIIVDRLGNNQTALGSVVTALFCFAYQSNSFADAAATALRLGGNATAIVSMTLALSGAHLGVEGIPPAWIEGLEPAEITPASVRTLARTLADLS